MKAIWKTALTITLLAAGRPAFAEGPADVYSFAIGPTQSPVELAKRWTPIMQYLTEKSGIKLEFKTAKDIPTFQQQMRGAQYDFAFINPFHYLVYNKGSGYTAIAREKDGKLTGIIVVKKDGPIKTAAQLSGQTMAFPAATAIAATWLPIHMLKENGVEVTPQYVNSMDSVYKSVAKGLFPAGGGEMRTFGTLDPAVKAELQVLWTADPLPPFAFAAHPRVPKDVMDKVQKAMDGMDQNVEGSALLKANNFKGMEVADDKDYDAMRKLNIKPVEAK